MVNPVYLTKPIRIEGLLCIRWLALLVYLLIERKYRNHTKESKQKRRTTSHILEAVKRYTWVWLEVPWWGA
jgi:transposase